MLVSDDEVIDAGDFVCADEQAVCDLMSGDRGGNSLSISFEFGDANIGTARLRRTPNNADSPGSGEEQLVLSAQLDWLAAGSVLILATDKFSLPGIGNFVGGLSQINRDGVLVSGQYDLYVGHAPFDLDTLVWSYAFPAPEFEGEFKTGIGFGPESGITQDLLNPIGVVGDYYLTQRLTATVDGPGRTNFTLIVKVPEPGTLALLAFGFAAIPLLSRPFARSAPLGSGSASRFLASSQPETNVIEQVA
jgi:hypothetical protein